MWSTWIGIILSYVIITMFYLSDLSENFTNTKYIAFTIFCAIDTVFVFFYTDRGLQFFYQNHRRAYQFNSFRYIANILKYFIITPSVLIFIYFNGKMLFEKFNIFEGMTWNLNFFSGWVMYVINIFVCVFLFLWFRKYFYVFL